VNDGLCALLLLFDFLAAFPSVAHAWIFACLEMSGAPQYLLNMVKGLYHNSRAFVRVPSGFEFAFYFLSGILQGCPLSGSLFAISIEPLIRALRKTLHSKFPDGRNGLARACADDIAIAIPSITKLLDIFPLFERIAKAAGLVLQMRKTLFIPTSIEWSESLVSEIRAWISEHIPAWTDVLLQPCGKYLGIYIGPKAGSYQWIAPLSKYSKRASLIAASGAGPSISAYQYNATAAPVLGYVSQLVAPPSDLINIERKVLTHLLHIPTSAFDNQAFHSLSLYGAPRLTSLRVLMYATAYRSAAKTASTWPFWAETLQKAAFIEDLASLHSLFDDRYHPRIWEALPFCAFLTNVMAASSGNPLADIGIERCTDELTKHSTSGSRSSLGVQKLAYAHLNCTMHVDTFPELFRTRLCKFFPSIADKVLKVDFQIVAASLKQIKPFFAMCVIRTFCNGWSTTARYHDGVSLS